MPLTVRPRRDVGPTGPLTRALARLAAACLLACALDPGVRAQEREANPRPVRSTTKWGLSLISDGCLKSVSFRALVARLKESRVIVYVEPAQQLPGLMVGATELLGVSGEFRYLRVSIGAQAARKTLIALIGHELQHATEIAGAPEVVDAGTLASFYRRVGDVSVDGYDTAAARRTGDAVLDELWRWRGDVTAGPADDTEKPPLARRPLNAELTRQ